MIRVAILDRHPAVRAGVDALLRARAGFAPAGCAAGAHDFWNVLYRTDPDVVVLDDLAQARRVKVEAPRARVILYTARVTPDLVLAAAVAGADGVVDKASDDLLQTIRAVAAGERALPAVRPSEHARAARRLDARDRPIFAMRLAGTSPREIAAVVGLGVAALNGRIQAIVGQLAPVTAVA